ncbi:MAG: alpha/beta hydrolase [Actinomycetota bacterium]|nr:alpha/beta hydrolase [Actinomycetota bacterium]
MADIRFACIGGVRIAFEVRDDAAPREAPWLVLLHGLGYGRRGWGPVVHRLAEHFRVVLVDNRGIGDSDVPEGPYTAAEMAADVVAVLDEAGIDRAHLLATSLGGMIAQEVACRYPERVERLVLVASTPGGEAAYPIPERTLQLIADMSELEPRELLRRAVENACHDDTVKTRPQLVEQIVSSRLEEAQDPDGWRAQAAAGVTYQADERLASIQAPTLVIHGDGDHVVDPRNADLLAAQIPSARQVRLAGAGHLAYWEDPARFAREVVDFLLANHEI